MKLMSESFRFFIDDESGATAIEYGLIAAVVGLGIIASLSQVSGGITNTFAKIGTSLTN